MKNLQITLFTALVAVFLCLSAYAATPSIQGPFRALDANGNPCAGCKLYTYEAGTTTDKDTYTDSTEATTNTNPVILDSDGFANVWLGEGAYKLDLKDPNDAAVSAKWPIDNVSGSSVSSFGDQVTSISTTTSITSAYENDLILTTSSPTLNLWGAATAGEGWTFVVKNTDSGTTTIDPNGSETIDGSATLTLDEDEWAIIYSDGTNWQTTGTTPINGGTITDQSEVAFTSADYILISDTSDSGNLKKDTAQGILDLAWPVGSIHINISCTNPGTLFGGTWSAFGEGKMLISLDSGDTDFDEAEETGGRS